MRVREALGLASSNLFSVRCNVPMECGGESKMGEGERAKTEKVISEERIFPTNFLFFFLSFHGHARLCAWAHEDTGWACDCECCSFFFHSPPLLASPVIKLKMVWSDVTIKTYTIMHVAWKMFSRIMSNGERQQRNICFIELAKTEDSKAFFS